MKEDSNPGPPDYWSNFLTTIPTRNTKNKCVRISILPTSELRGHSQISGMSEVNNLRYYMKQDFPRQDAGRVTVLFTCLFCANVKIALRSDIAWMAFFRR